MILRQRSRLSAKSLANTSALSSCPLLPPCTCLARSTNTSFPATTRKLPHTNRPFSSVPPRRGPSNPPNQGSGGFPIGNIFGGGAKREPGETLKANSQDLTQLARDNLLDPIIGRDAEIKRVVQILSRRTKSNPVLLGEAGVGKTAIIEGLAQRILNKEVPESLFGKRVLSIDLANIVSNTGIRGSFEEKLRNLIQDIEEDPTAICFIDELHGLLKLGQAEGSISGGNMLKPALARGLQIIGATTFDEYRGIEKDAALARRFQPVHINEPTVPETVTILRGLRARYEAFHGIVISDAALVEAANLSDRYITDRFMPDKAIDLVDEAASALAMQQRSKPEDLELLERQIVALQIERASLVQETDAQSVSRKDAVTAELEEKQGRQRELTAKWEAERDRLDKIKQAKADLEKAQADLAEAERLGNFERASELKYRTIRDLEVNIKAFDDADDHAVSSGMLPSNRVEAQDIARVVSRMTGIPVKSFRQEADRLSRIEEILRARVLGQDEAVAAVANAVRISRAGMNAPGRPLASFLFLGSTGVGKTELSKALATYLFDSDRSLITVNMSEFSEKHTVSKLIGAPAGYVGFEDGGQLTEAVRRKPYSVVLLDEFEKAHPEVSNILLQVLDEGTLKDSHGRDISFKNTILILTSNLGSHYLGQLNAADDNGLVTSEAKDLVLNEVAARYPPELLNRLDSQIVFNRLGRQSMLGLVDLRLSEVRETLADKRVSLHVKSDARAWLADRGYNAAYGARALNRLITRHVRSRIADMLISGEVQPGATISIAVVDDALAYTVLPTAVTERA